MIFFTVISVTHGPSSLNLAYFARFQVYSGAPLIQSPMGQKKMAVLMGDRNNEGLFLQENLWPFFRAAKKSGRNDKVIVLPR